MALLLKKRKDVEYRRKLEIHEVRLRASEDLTMIGDNSLKKECIVTSKKIGNIDIDEEDYEEGENDSNVSIPQKFTKNGRKRAVPFPIKLMMVLSSKEYEHIICWAPSGKAFIIDKPKLFTSEILPQHFKTAKYSSFTRKLNRWGFMRNYRGLEPGSFFHPGFVRDRFDLVEKMACLVKVDEQNTNILENGQNAMVRAKENLSEVCKKNSNQKVVVVNPIQEERLDEAYYRNLSVSMSSSIQQQSDIDVIRRVSLPNTSPPIPDPVVGRENKFSFIRHCDPDLHSRTQSGSATASQQVSSTPVGACGNISDQLNAAIEVEVYRRLYERMNYVTLAKQALDIIQYPQQPLLLPNHNSLFLGSQNAVSWNNQSFNRTALLEQELQNRDAMQSAQAMSDARRILSMVQLGASIRNTYKSDTTSAATARLSNGTTFLPTNIQSAKTA